MSDREEDQDDYVIETVHGVRTKVPKEFFEKYKKNVKKGVDKDDTV